MLLSIVTVCKNEEKRIRRTVRSVLSQEGTDYEYIVLDGKSEDNTLNVLDSFQKEFADNGVSYKVVSKSDSGIYNAMNNALEYVKGDWILYLNAGDCLYSKKVTRIIDNYKEKCDIIYGNFILIENGYYKNKKPSDYHNLPTMMPMCHQSVLCRTELMKKYQFREKYRLAADYDFLLRAYWEGKNFEYVNNIISIYTLDGQSTSNAWKYQLEMIKSGKEVYGINLKFQFKAFLNSCIRMGKIFLANTLNNQYHSPKRGWRKIKK